MKIYNIPIYQIDAFTQNAFQGNPAAICPLTEWLDDDLLQQIAEENNLSETAYFVPENDGFRLRWFTPQCEVELCGHATLATAWLLWNTFNYQYSSIKFYTLSGELFVHQKENLLQLDFPAKSVQAIVEPTGLLDALGVTENQILGIYQSDDIIIEFKNEVDIETLTPNFETLKTFETRGVIATSRSEHFDFISRWFGPRSGINEDPVTGSAHTSLIPFWKQKIHKPLLIAQQGSTRKGQLYCELSDDGQRVYISGHAILIMSGQLSIPI